jgi:NTE family protein
MMKERNTALVLGGGGSRGAYEAGVWQALTELGVEFSMVCGVSVGSINAALVAQGDVDKANNLWKQIATDMVFDVSPDATAKDFAIEFIKKGGASVTSLKALVEKYLDEDAVRRSSIELGLLTTEFPSLKPCPLWISDIPEGRLADYIVASSAAFPAVHYYEVDGVKYIDGGYSNNLPIPMAMDHGATDCIAVYMNAPGKYYPEQAENVENVTLIKSKWDLGDFLVFDPNNSKRTVRLGYQHTMKKVGAYDGDFFSFFKGVFDKRDLAAADVTARIFDLDPLILYSREKFLNSMRQAVASARSEMELDVDMSFASIKSLRDLPAMDIIRGVAKVANRRTLTLFIADNIKAHGGSSIFLRRYTGKLLTDETLAARWLIRMELV